MRPALAAVLAGAAAAVLLAASVLVSDGSSDGRVAWIGAAAVLLAGGGVVAALWGRVAVPALSRFGWAFFALLAAFVAWNGISVLWSIEPDRTWSYVNRGIVYLAFAVLGALVGSYGRQVVVLVAYALAVVFAIAIGWALLVKAVPALDSYEGRIARLNAPIGYWNALALLIAMALPLGLWLLGRREHRVGLRVAGAVFVYGSVAALLLTYSRGGFAVGALALAAWFLLGRPRIESAVGLVLAGGAGAAVAIWAFTRPGLANDGEPYSSRFHAGIWFAVVLVVVGVAVGIAAYLLAGLDRRSPLVGVRREALGRLLVTGLVVLVLAFGALTVARGGGPSRLWHNFTHSASPQVNGGPTRFVNLSSSSRSTWWAEAWRAFKAHPAGGTGAGSFELTDRRYRTTSGLTLEPHSLPFQFLSETGIVGFLLGAAATLAALLATVRRRGDDRVAAAAAALAVVPVAYFLHALVDFDWDFLAVSAPCFFVVGVLAAQDRDARAREATARPLWAAGACLLACAAVYSLLAPWFAARKVEDAYAALAHGSTRSAASAARDAHDLNPLALEPLLAWAAAEQVGGNEAAARKLYVRAVRLQPMNARSWYELGRFELDSGDMHRAREFLHRAAELDPQGPAKGS